MKRTTKSSTHLYIIYSMRIEKENVFDKLKIQFRKKPVANLIMKSKGRPSSFPLLDSY